MCYQKKSVVRQIIVIFLVIFVLAWGYDEIISPSYQWRYERVERRFHYLHSGMRKEEVINLIGKPKNIRRIGTPKGVMTEEQWILHFRPHQELIPVCIFPINGDILIKAEMMHESTLD